MAVGGAVWLVVGVITKRDTCDNGAAKHSTLFEDCELPHWLGGSFCCRSLLTALPVRVAIGLAWVGSAFVCCSVVWATLRLACLSDVGSSVVNFQGDRTGYQLKDLKGQT